MRRPDHDCYHWAYPVRVNTMLRAYVNREDFEVQLIFEENKASRIICTTADLSELQSALEQSRWRYRIHRKVGSFSYSQFSYPESLSNCAELENPTAARVFDVESPRIRAFWSE